MRWEGLKKDAYWAFNLSSTDGVQLLRLSSDKQDLAQNWVKVRAMGRLGFFGGGSVPSSVSMSVCRAGIMLSAVPRPDEGRCLNSKPCPSRVSCCCLEVAGNVVSNASEQRSQVMPDSDQLAHKVGSGAIIDCQNLEPHGLSGRQCAGSLARLSVCH